MRYYCIKRVPYCYEVEVGFFDAETEQEMNDKADELDDGPLIGSLIVMTEEEWNNFKNSMTNPEDWN